MGGYRTRPLDNPNNHHAPDDYRAGFVTLVGRTNVGKSTLLNRMVGQKVAIVTPRPQTTRRRILGIRTDADAQYLFVDTPGIHEPRNELSRRMVEIARRCVGEGEVVVAVVEAGARLGDRDRAVIAELGELKLPRVVVINKIDKASRADLMALVEECGRAIPEAEIVPVSALKGDNIDELLAVIKRMLPVSPALMPADEYTDQTERMIAAEVIREKIFVAMREEIPFSTAVTVEEFVEDGARGITRISAVIIVERDSHKGMIIGAGGARLKAIGTAARLELEEMLGVRIFLETIVKVEKGWTRNPRRIGELES
ncbi:MAG TPA: GTPase Era [Candidatus Binataceae bacterium]|nr:GTPase Era [Candidatus Binataceae bacterium]